MFNKVNDYNPITVTTYADGSVLHQNKVTFDFDNGARVVEKYLKESEKFKMVSLKAQSDISENKTLTDDTLKITLEVNNHVYTFVSAAGFINLAYAKVLAQMKTAELDKLSALVQDASVKETVRMQSFQDMINQCCTDDAVVSVGFTAHVRIHDSYTKEHVSAIKYIINSMCMAVEEKDNELVVVSEDPDLKNAIIDLGMSTYFDIEIEE